MLCDGVWLGELAWLTVSDADWDADDVTVPTGLRVPDEVCDGVSACEALRVCVLLPDWDCEGVAEPVLDIDSDCEALGAQVCLMAVRREPR